MSSGLPIEEVRAAVEEVLDRLGRVVISAPTGSGKSTCVPVWLTERGRVLVVEPRRVACSALAARVGDMVRSEMGAGAVGYVVRHANTMSSKSRIVFATPGVVLRWLANPESSPQFDVIVLDEFHERTLQTDLLAAIALSQQRKPLVVMSATVAGDRVAAYIGGEHVSGKGRMHPVDISYAAGGLLLPDARELAERVARAVNRVWDEATGDILVFVPGKGEIRACARSIAAARPKARIIELHGGLSLKDQGRVFASSKERKVIVATNVAETSLTVPGIGVVIDTGLVRRTRYHGGRGVLTLVPIATDSATQRSGRAGRTRAGMCVRLWSEQARLSDVTPPEIARDSLVPLVLAACNAGADVRSLPFLDPPAPHAVEAAFQELGELGALTNIEPEAGGATLTSVGASLFRLPIEPALGRLLVEAQRRPEPTPGDVLDLVAALSVRGAMFHSTWEDEDLRAIKNDALALIAAVRCDPGQRREVQRRAWDEAQQRRVELSRLVGRSKALSAVGDKVDVEGLKATVLTALPTSVFVKRKRQRKTTATWGGPGVEVTLGRESALDAEKVDAMCALALFAAGGAHGKPMLRVSAAVPLRFNDLVKAGIGDEAVTHVAKVKRRIVATLERSYGGRVIGQREEAPKGALARQAIAKLMLERRLFRRAVDDAQEGLRRWALARRLARMRRVDPFEGADGDTLELPEFVAQRLSDLGVESGNDLALLEAVDFAVEPLPDSVASRLSRDFPSECTIGGRHYRCVYEVATNTVVLELTKGDGKRPPPVALLPRFAGMKVALSARGKRRALRD